jgi:hypothetical protein
MRLPLTASGTPHGSTVLWGNHGHLDTITARIYFPRDSSDPGYGLISDNWGTEEPRKRNGIRRRICIGGILFLFVDQAGILFLLFLLRSQLPRQ